MHLRVFYCARDGTQDLSHQWCISDVAHIASYCLDSKSRKRCPIPAALTSTPSGSSLGFHASSPCLLTFVSSLLYGIISSSPSSQVNPSLIRRGDISIIHLQGAFGLKDKIAFQSDPDSDPRPREVTDNGNKFLKRD